MPDENVETAAAKSNGASWEAWAEEGLSDNDKYRHSVCAGPEFGGDHECIAETFGATPEIAFSRAQLTAAAPDLLSVLKAVEWNGPSSTGMLMAVCPSCEAYKSDNKGHYENCDLAAAIAKATGIGR